MLSRGLSGKLCQGGTLFLVNQSHPFKLHYRLSSNGSTSSGPLGSLKANDKSKGARNGKGKEETPSSPGPKRSIKDFFAASPVKVQYWVVFGLICTFNMHVQHALLQFKHGIGPRTIISCR